MSHLRLAYRVLRREPGAAAVAIVSLAIGIAANATVFSLVQAVEFPNLIYPESSRLVFVESANLERDLSEMPISAPDAQDIARVTHTIVGTSLSADDAPVLREAAVPSRQTGRQVAASFFSLFRVQARKGRTLAEGDGPDALVISDRLWRTQLSADPAIVGRQLHLDGEVAVVVGVMPPRFDLDADFWRPMRPATLSAPRDDRRFTAFGRLAPTASLADARAELARASAVLATGYPATNRGWVMFPTLLSRQHGQDSRGVFFLLQGAVAFVLLIACANIANLLLARATRREHEMGVRVALGASRGQLVRQLLTESLLLSAAGGLLGVALSVAGIHLARTIGGFPDAIDPTLNLAVVAFTAAVSILTGVLCGIVPALRASAADPERVLRDSGPRAGDSRKGGRLRSALVVVQVAAAFLLATGGGLMLQTLSNREHVDLGFNPAGAWRASVLLSGLRYTDPARIAAVVEYMVGRWEQRPSIVSAGVSAFRVASVGSQTTVTVPASGASLPSSVRLGVEVVTPNYFTAAGIPRKHGRVFTAADRAGSAPVAIVNEELVRHLWPGRSPEGETARLGSGDSSGTTVTIVGVVGSVRRSGMHDGLVSRIYLPFAQSPNPSVALAVRARADMRAAAVDLVSVVRETDPSLVVEDVNTMEADVAQFLDPIRLIALLLGGFGTAGVLLAALGVFGTMAYVVSRREREIAVRSALGASPAHLIWMVLRSGVSTAAIGIGVGIVASIGLARVLGSLLYGVAVTDPLTLAGVAIVLVLAALAACYRPARAAARVDPISVLRQ